MSRGDIQYSTKYEDNMYIYRHVILPEDMAKLLPKTHLMTETEWRNLGIQMTSGWMHYMRYDPGMHK
ncbi:PREDICTED: cyclin-dependent kinases regulatory subunit 1-like [Diuraphis noxia]|uniref:cyclin-dependent kinases regulatory subunit 1-like n=1 Tax=Diuraphis noxia TaxID=143948 RepID=UPI000763B284|nr:PREDICTED: cyclin-dependent kinases regulatory subunit 1-like [Diuraphis noxia]